MCENKSPDRLHIAIEIIKPIAALLVIGFLYLFFFQKYELGIPCIFRKLTGYQCPGCGMTHAMVKIWNGEFQDAFHDNALSVTVLPVTCMYLLYRYIKVTVNRREEFHVWEYIFLVAALIAAISYGYIRNQV